jgi:hypothetical protein
MAPPPSATDEFEAFWGKAVPAAAPHRQAHRQESQAGDRLLLVIVIFLGAFGLLTGRLIELTLLRPDEARIASIGPYIPPPMRAEILDRNGEMLATNLNVASLYANPAEVWDVHEAVTKLARIFPALDSKKTEERLTAKGQFIWIKRDLRSGISACPGSISSMSSAGPICRVRFSRMSWAASISTTKARRGSRRRSKPGSRRRALGR